MWLCPAHHDAGIEVFVYGEAGGSYPARQHREASAAIARRHRLDPGRTLLVRQSPDAIAAGAFHNDVVAVANEHVLFAHEQAFAEPGAFYASLRHLLPQVEIVEVPTAVVSLADAVASYLFNAELVALPEGRMALILPLEARRNASVWTWLNAFVARGGPIRKLELVDVRQSMANGGGPACLRLRVGADPRTIDPRFLASYAKLEICENAIRRSWPREIDPEDLHRPTLWAQCRAARIDLLSALGFADGEL